MYVCCCVSASMVLACLLVSLSFNHQFALFCRHFCAVSFANHTYRHRPTWTPTQCWVRTSISPTRPFWLVRFVCIWSGRIMFVIVDVLGNLGLHAASQHTHFLMRQRVMCVTYCLDAYIRWCAPTRVSKKMHTHPVWSCDPIQPYHHEWHCSICQWACVVICMSGISMCFQWTRLSVISFDFGHWLVLSPSHLVCCIGMYSHVIVCEYQIKGPK